MQCYHKAVDWMQLLMLNTVFLGSLKEDICTWVQEEGPQQAQWLSQDTQRNWKHHQWQEEREGLPCNEDWRPRGRWSWGDKAAQLCEVNAILIMIVWPQYCFRVQPWRGLQRGPNGTRAGDSFSRTGAITCFFWNKPGYRIAKCHKNPSAGWG